VAPQEVEHALLAHPGVAEAAVVGRPDGRTGEAPVAFVVLRDESLSAEALTEFVSRRLATYKRPREYHIVDELPRTSGGKLQRSRLPGRPPQSRSS
jgi:acyl-CoA synthetase (AMP-forming)/AMP-acid ligase II